MMRKIYKVTAILLFITVTLYCNYTVMAAENTEINNTESEIIIHEQESHLPFDGADTHETVTKEENETRATYITFINIHIKKGRPNMVVGEQD